MCMNARYAFKTVWCGIYFDIYINFRFVSFSLFTCVRQTAKESEAKVYRAVEKIPGQRRFALAGQRPGNHQSKTVRYFNIIK